MRINGIGVVCCAAGIMAMVAGNQMSAETVAQKESVKAAEPRQEVKTERFLNGRLPIGFYIYLYNWRQWNDAEAHDLDDAVEEMARRGFNYLYVGGTSDTPLWSHLLELCEKRHIGRGSTNGFRISRICRPQDCEGKRPGGAGGALHQEI